VWVWGGAAEGGGKREGGRGGGQHSQQLESTAAATQLSGSTSCFSTLGCLKFQCMRQIWCATVAAAAAAAAAAGHISLSSLGGLCSLSLPYASGKAQLGSTAALLAQVWSTRVCVCGGGGYVQGLHCSMRVRNTSSACVSKDRLYLVGRGCVICQWQGRLLGVVVADALSVVCLWLGV
jgi:hypothetical protein